MLHSRRRAEEHVQSGARMYGDDGLPYYPWKNEMTPGTTPPNTPPSPEAQAAPKRRLGQRPRLFLACLGAAVGIAIILSACGNSTAGSTPSSAPTPTVAQSLTTPNGSSA